MAISLQLLNILVCPVTKESLIYDQDKQELISLSAGLAYPIIDEIPIMLVDKARKLDAKRLQEIKDRRKQELNTQEAEKIVVTGVKSA